MIYKFFRDPIYDTIEVDEDEILSLIATAEFQRLRSIKQLGFSYFVYPGCEHTRFQHSLGVYHLMKMALRSICGLSEEEKLAALISGLTHDIGHGAFSHVTEKAILTRKHERYTCDILETILPEIVDKTCSKIAIDIIKKSYEHKPFLSDLLSSQLDVDRLDYLVRDSYYAGVKYGTVDVQRLLSSICLYKDPDENRTSISFAQKSVYSIEGYILNAVYNFEFLS